MKFIDGLPVCNLFALNALWVFENTKHEIYQNTKTISKYRATITEVN